ncbi:hypothetical protein HNI00_04455 [Thermoleptolyngbya oregonensis NK1-22]|uniref:Uncharacterized protein n=1 Tax=Thermoleptolyngbya oregonensis NK1-22 TaxID=2547457 RepID=A0AA96Y0K3_9CYAN|nr:hypothetical protein [Thermoleptolyngbya oregonensis]WOB41717.1 hypothetical protein HNI00_04455 [Thermoleptolyngbya oregonensis NK1-22]
MSLVQPSIVRDLPFVRSYVLQDGHLFLLLFADGGIDKFELAPRSSHSANL